MALTRITKGVIKPNENYDTHNINSTGIVTAIGLDVNGNGDISGNLNVGGVLTYEDVTSIDSVGIITARNGIDCNGDIDVDGHTNLDNVSIAGITTVNGGFIFDNGTNAGKDLQWQPSNNRLAFFNDVKATFGNTVDLQIYHNSTENHIYGSTNKPIIFSTNTDERLRITSSGRVVIGHSAANAKLHIATGTNSAVGDATNPAFQIGSTNNYRFAIHTTNELAVIANKNGDDGIAFHTKTADGGSFGTALRITSGGQVNIGGEYAQTDSKVNIIDASKAIQEATLNLQSSATSGAADTGAVLRFYGHSGTEGRYHSSIKGAKENGTSGNYAGYLSFNTRPNGSAMQERLRITSTGKLEVKGTRDGALQANDDDALKLFTKSTSDDINRGTGITFYTHDGSGYEMGGTIQVAKENGTVNDPKSYMRFSTQSGSTTEERLRITSGGAVLLGATVASNAEQFRIHTSDSGKAIIKLTNSTTGTGSGDGFEFGMNGNEQIEFVNKENTDMFFATNNTERLRIDSNGDLNLGNNPTNQYGYKLNIQDTSILYAQTASDGNGTELKLNLDHGNTVATFGTVSSSHLSFVTGNTERLRIKSNGTITSTGYMGVGTDNPQVRLHVHNGSNNLGTTIRLSQDYNSVYSAIASNFGGSMSLHAGQGSVNAIMHFTINGEEKMRIKSGGGLKLDNTASGNLFEYGGSSVYGNSAIDIYRLGQGYADLRLSSNYGVKIALAGASNNTDEFVLQQDNSKNVYIKNEASQPIYFQTGSSNTTRVAIKHSGAGGVDISGEAAYNDANSGARGIDISYNASTSIPVYFGTETNVAQKSMYLKGYWIYLRGHVNEGIRFNFSQSSGAPHSDMYQFKYNSATRPGGSNTWDGFSDARAKENVVSITNGIETIKKLRPVTFDWTNDYADSVDMYVMGKDENGGSVARKENGYDTDMKNGRYGFIAQEYETVLPKDVKQDKFTLGDTEINDFRTINHDSLIPTLTAALKEAVAKIEVLEERISALEGS